MKIKQCLVVFLVMAAILSCSAKKNSNSPQQCAATKDTTTAMVPTANTSSEAPTVVQKEVIGKYSGSNEEGDYWYFYITGHDGTKIRFIYTSEDVLKSKAMYEGKMLVIKYIDKVFEEAGSGKTFTEKHLESIDIKQ